MSHYAHELSTEQANKQCMSMQSAAKRQNTKLCHCCFAYQSMTNQCRKAQMSLPNESRRSLHSLFFWGEMVCFVCFWQGGTCWHILAHFGTFTNVPKCAIMCQHVPPCQKKKLYKLLQKIYHTTLNLQTAVTKTLPPYPKPVTMHCHNL